MSLTQPETKGPGSPGLSTNLSSNNPFRNRAASPTLSSEAPPRPMSRNPFLDSSSTTKSPFSTSPTMSLANGAPSAPRAPLTGNAAELFDNLTLSDRPNPTSDGMRSPPPPPYSLGDKKLGGAPRSENIPPRGGPMHRPTRSQEEAMRARRVATAGPGRARPPNGELNIFADPESPKKSGERRPRRNSDSSVLERNGKPLDPEEEKKRQERRRRERRHREREAGRDPKKKDRKLDIIDQLDATSIFGTGLFHHDGPFDACNPHRNRAGSRRAPMQAFPKDSLNNVLGGGGPLNKRPDHATFLGNNDGEAFKDYAASSTTFESYSNGTIRRGSKGPEPVVLSAKRVELIHGDESLGLGTSTFLEGAPASRIAIQRRETETAAMPEVGGLQRKKSLAQKIRGISTNRRDFGPSGRITSPEGVYGPKSPELPPGVPRASLNEKNPFAKEFEAKEDKIDIKKEENKEEGSTVVEPEVMTGRPRAPSSPRRGYGERLERRVTGDGGSGGEEQSKTGFLSRVKSLKGGKKPRPERPERPV